MSSARFFGIILFSASLYAQIPAAPETPAAQELHDAHANPMIGRARVPVTASGEALIADEAPKHSANKPISGIVSLRELEHRIPEKALRQAYEAQQYARANDFPKAIAKFEGAIRIYPPYRDAHLNLGVVFARAGRGAEARAEFQKALDIGPPAAPIYIDLALASLALHRYRDAETFARQALELDPANSLAQRSLEYASSH